MPLAPAYVGRKRRAKPTVAFAISTTKSRLGKEKQSKHPVFGPLTLATAHDNLAAQHIYKKMGYVREEHFLYFHRLLP